MQSPNRQYMPEVDQLRGLAALLVFFYHTVHTGRGAAGAKYWPVAASPPEALLYEGHTGVALFMVLSGFILARGTLGAPIDYGRFIANRALRIFPLMTFVVVFAIYANLNITLEGILAPFLLLANTQPRFLADATYLTGTVWTISTEFQFYLIAPFLIAFVAKGGVRYVAMLILLVLIVRVIALVPHAGSPDAGFKVTYYTIVGRIGQFAIGIALAYLMQPGKRMMMGRARAFVLLAIALAAAMALAQTLNMGGGIKHWRNWMLVYHEVEGLIWAAAIAGYIQARPLALLPPLASLMTGIGVISFSAYLLHWPLEQLFWKLVVANGYQPSGVSTLELAAYATALLPVVLLVSWLSYETIEKPFLSLRKRYVVNPRERADA